MDSAVDHSTLLRDLFLEGQTDETRDTSALRLYHTMNNKLVPILTYAELGERVSRDKTVQAYCAKIHRSACDLRALIESAVERQGSAQGVSKW